MTLPDPHTLIEELELEAAKLRSDVDRAELALKKAEEELSRVQRQLTICESVLPLDAKDGYQILCRVAFGAPAWEGSD